jgi:HSP20 family protein
MFAHPASPTSNGKETMIVADWTPSVDISETATEYQIKAEIPDVKKEDGKVTLEDGVLNLHLPKSEKAKPKTIEVKVAA